MNDEIAIKLYQAIAEDNEVRKYSEVFEKYTVTKDGRVWSKRSKRYLNPYYSNYGRLKLNNKSFYIHRLVAVAHIPNPDNKPEVNHKDGNVRNNHIDNLEWVTPLENKRHAFSNGLIDHKGEKNAHAWLTDDLVQFIRELVDIGHTQKQVAEWFGVYSSTICLIVQRKSWRHI